MRLKTTDVIFIRNREEAIAQTKASDTKGTAQSAVEEKAGHHFKSSLGRNIFNFLFDEEVEEEEELDEIQMKSETTNRTLKQKQHNAKLTKRELLRKRVGESFLKVSP